MNDRVSLSINDHIADVRLNRPDKMNALDAAMFEAIIEAARHLAGEKSVRAVVLSGEGRSFCAGLDMASFTASPEEGAPASLEQRSHGNSNMFQAVAMLWRQLPVPVIAAVHGVCFGGGLQIASGADIRIITADARCAVMEMRWGLVPDMGGYALWRGNVRDDVLRELVYSNREFTGEQAVQMGFATHIDADPLARAMALAQEIAGKNPDAIRAAKRLSNQVLDSDEDAILLAESREQAAIIRTPNQMEAVMAQMQKRKAEFQPG